MKRGVLFLFVLLVFGILISGVIIAQDEGGDLDIDGDDSFDDGGFEDGFEEREKSDDAVGDFDCAVVLCQPGSTCVQGVGCLLPDEYEDELVREAEEFDEELKVDAGTLPGSPFYFVDVFFDKFGDDLEIREEKIAEMRAVADACGQGDESACADLKVAFESYEAHANIVEKEVSPEQQEEAERSSRAIRGVLVREIAKEIPATLKDDYVRAIVKEKNIATAAEIASKIKELCVALSQLDPLEYSRVCRTNDDAPDWHRRLDEGLTSEQEREAKEFFAIMSQCIETSGRECRCGDISIPAFGEICEKVAPLEAICDDDSVPEVEAEAACDEVDRLTENIEDLLPEHLIAVLDEVIEKFDDDDFEHHGPPRECREAGAFDRQSCMRVMILESDEIPRECRSALADALDKGVTSEREFDRICSTIMFERFAPPRCIQEGITDPRKCAELFEGEFGRGHDFGEDCRSLEDANRRLACYDRVTSGGGFDDGRSFEERFRETKELERQCAERCASEGKAWDFSDGCSCHGGGYEDDYSEYYYEGGSYSSPEEEYSPEYSPDEYYPEDDYDYSQESPPQCPENTYWDGSTCVSSSEPPPGGDEGSEETTTGTDTGGEEETTTGGDTDGGTTGGDDTGGESSTTGSVIRGGFITGNAFLDYYFGWWR